MVLVLTACPEGLRGYLTRWLIEVAPGVFIGSPTRRVQDLLWERTEEMIGRGKAVLVQSAPGEQRLAVRNHGHDWTPEDFDGVTLIRRPDESSAPAGRPPGWSAAARRRR